VDPPAANAALGTAVTFCAEAQGTGPFNYQWQKNGLNLPDQTNRCLALTNIAIADGASYRATVFTAAGAVESEEGVLTIALVSLPGADQFANGAPISVASNSVKGVSIGATRENGEPRHFSLSTSNSVWYSWRAPASGIATFDTRGSSFDTVLAVYEGNDLSALEELTSDDDSGGFHTSKVSWNAVAGQDYRVVIDGVTGENGTYVCSWNLEITAALLPVFTQQPRSQTVLPGGRATFLTLLTNVDLATTFQWYRNGQPLAGATSSNLVVQNVQPSDLGQYQLTVTNGPRPGAVSMPVDLEIGPDPTVQSQDKIAAVPGAGGAGGGAAGGELPFMMAGASAGTFSLAAGTVINQRFFSSGTMDRCEPAHCGVPGGASRWFQLAATTDGICTVDTQGSAVDTILAIYLQNFAVCTNLYEPLVDCNNDVLGSCDQLVVTNGARDRFSRVSFLAAAGTVYRAVVDIAGGIRSTNIQFNVHFGEALPANPLIVDNTAATALQMRGSSLALRVATNFVVPGNLYQWQINNRRIAGAGHEQIVLPLLNYSDAGRYSVLIQNGAKQTLLPGVAVVVIDPCHPTAAGTTGSVPARFQLVGTTAEPIILEATASLHPTSSWEVIGTILPNVEPALWDNATVTNRFYRTLQWSP
jgi:hypothetical protein